MASFKKQQHANKKPKHEFFMTYHSRVAGVECGLEALLFSFSSSVTHRKCWIEGQKCIVLYDISSSGKLTHQTIWQKQCMLFSLRLALTARHITSISKKCSQDSSVTVTMIKLLTFIIGHVPKRRVAGVSFALTLVEASFNPTL